MGTGIARLPQLAEDDPAGAQRDLDALLNSWPRRDFLLQHLAALFTQVSIHLYRRDGPAAWRYVQERAGAIAGSHLLRVQMLRIMTVYYSGCAALGAAEIAPEPGPLLRAARDAARRLEREKAPWAKALAGLIAAGAAALRGDTAGTAALLADVAPAFDGLAMSPFAAAARRRLGELRGGEEGRALVTRADATMAEQGVVNPARMTALYAPGFRGPLTARG
jgi:hypothetical protein